MDSTPWMRCGGRGAANNPRKDLAGGSRNPDTQPQHTGRYTMTDSPSSSSFARVTPHTSLSYEDQVRLHWERLDSIHEMAHLRRDLEAARKWGDEVEIDRLADKLYTHELWVNMMTEQLELGHYPEEDELADAPV